MNDRPKLSLNIQPLEPTTKQPPEELMEFQAGSIPDLLDLRGFYDEFGTFRPNKGYPLKIRQPSVREVFWCRFTDSIVPEVGKERPVVILSRKNPLGTFSVVAPLTTDDENAQTQHAVLLSKNPSLSTNTNSWVLANHLCTVSHWRLRRFWDPVARKVITPRVSEADHEAIIRAAVASLATDCLGTFKKD